MTKFVVSPLTQYLLKLRNFLRESGDTVVTSSMVCLQTCTVHTGMLSVEAKHVTFYKYSNQYVLF